MFILLRCVNVSNQYVVHLKVMRDFSQLYLSQAGKKKKSIIVLSIGRLVILVLIIKYDL